VQFQSETRNANSELSRPMARPTPGLPVKTIMCGMGPPQARGGEKLQCEVRWARIQAVGRQGEEKPELPEKRKIQ
jgi:hypothetical protein